MTAALHWKQAILWARSLSPNWAVGALVVLLLTLVFSRFVEEGRWPFLNQIGTEKPTIVHDAATPEEIEKATAPFKAHVTQLQAALDDMARQRDAARADRASKQVSRAPAPASDLTDSLRLISWAETLGPCRTNGFVHICGLIITGTSNATSNIRFKSAQFTGINGDVADLKIDLGAEGKIPATEAKIPPGASFTLWLEINPYLDAYAFMAKWGRIYFNAEYEGTRFSRSFDEDRMREMLGPQSFNPRPVRDKNGN